MLRGCHATTKLFCDSGCHRAGHVAGTGQAMCLNSAEAASIGSSAASRHSAADVRTIKCLKAELMCAGLMLSAGCWGMQPRQLMARGRM